MGKSLLLTLLLVATAASGKTLESLPDFILTNSCFEVARKSADQDYPRLVFEYLDRRLKGKIKVEPQGEGTLITYQFADKTVASLRFTAKLDTVWVDGMFVPEDKRGQGVGTLLYARMMALPELQLTSSLSGLLSSDNLSAFQEAVSEGKQPEDAMRETPAFKIRAVFGYSIIDSQSDYGNGHVILVTRRSRLWPYLY